MSHKLDVRKCFCNWKILFCLCGCQILIIYQIKIGNCHFAQGSENTFDYLLTLLSSSEKEGFREM